MDVNSVAGEKFCDLEIICPASGFRSNPTTTPQRTYLNFPQISLDLSLRYLSFVRLYLSHRDLSFSVDETIVFKNYHNHRL